jgi:hypothetical protein
MVLRADYFPADCAISHRKRGNASEENKKGVWREPLTADLKGPWRSVCAYLLRAQSRRLRRAGLRVALSSAPEACMDPGVGGM